MTRQTFASHYHAVVLEHADATETGVLVSSVVELAQALVRIPSRGGIDDYTAIIETLEDWLTPRAMKPQRLLDDGGHLVGLTCEVSGAAPGPTYVLDATIDTAPFGDPDKWTHGPLSGDLEDGWLYGRGAADSKGGVAVFAHVAEHLTTLAPNLAGRVILLFEGDEHNGSFNGATTFFESHMAGRTIDGLFIGYPGSDRIVVGGRGFTRFTISLHGESAHSGSSRGPVSNAVSRAADLVIALDELNTTLAGRTDPDFGLPAKVTVTSIEGGEGFSVIPDLCRIGVDFRLTPSLDHAAAHQLVRDVVDRLDAGDPGPPSQIEVHEGWPPFRTPDDADFVQALRRGAEEALGRPIPLEVVGPSNIANYVCALGIPAIAGFGPVYRNLHGADECIEVASIGPVYRAYCDALVQLLTERGHDE